MPLVSRVNQGFDLYPLIEIVHHRWNIPIIAELYRRSGAKFVTLANHLKVGRTSLSVSLKHLIELGVVRKNVGHGHPMRPEYLLTKRGLAIGSDCLSLLRIVRRRNEIDLAFRKWTLPLVAAIGQNNLRFNELRTALHDATPRAITIGLKSLLQQRWANRTLFDGYPPAAGYELRPKGKRILVCLNGLGRLD